MSEEQKNALDKAMDGMGCFDEYVLTVTDTVGFLKMAVDAEENKRNKSVYVERLRKDIDPDGIHVLNEMFSLLHNDFEHRGMWLVKLKGREEPVTLWLDVDLKLFHECVSVKRLSKLEVEERMEREGVKR